MDQKTPKVAFTRQQIEFLNNQFPEKTSPSLTADERLWNAAQRHVIACMKDWVAKPGDSY